MRERRKSGRRRRSVTFLLFICFLGICLVAGVVLILSGNVFLVKNIEVRGNSLIGTEDIVELSGIEKGMKLLEINKDAIRDNLLRSPYIVVKDVKTALPDTVIIEITERKPIILVKAEDSWFLADKEGMLLKETLDSDMSPQLIGLDLKMPEPGRKIGDEDDIKARRTAMLIEALAESDLRHMIEKIDVSDINGIKMLSQTGIRIEFGQAMEIEKKIERLAALLPELDANGARGVLSIDEGVNKARFTPDG